MRLTITDVYVCGEQTLHTAVPAHEATRTGPWRVSWLPGRAVTRTQAVTALVLAEAVAVMQHEGASVAANYTHRLWPHFDGWAAELDLTGPPSVRAHYRHGAVMTAPEHVRVRVDGPADGVAATVDTLTRGRLSHVSQRRTIGGSSSRSMGDQATTRRSR